jgi:hypothetical protein
MRSVWRRARRRLAASLGAALVSSACATPPEIYVLPEEHYRSQQAELTEADAQLERGRPLAPLDLLNHWVLSLPTKLLLLNWHLLDHRLEPEGEAILRHYLELNGLREVKVRHNQYAPLDELSRLARNSDVGWPYRYTLGLVTWLRYTLFPDRLFAGVPLIGGGDHFNPFTNTIHVYSSDVAVLIHEAGHAKDYLEHDSRGTSFALARLVPVVDLLQEARASSDAIQYLQCIREMDHELHAYRALIPAYSTYIAGYFEGGLIVTLPIVAAGHVSGRLQAWRRGRERDRPNPRVDFLPPWCRPLEDPEVTPAQLP